VSGNGNGTGGAGRKFLRGYQITDANGVAEFTSQFFFDESLTDKVHALSPYSSYAGIINLGVQVG
jgi:hypothetical protein